MQVEAREIKSLLFETFWFFFFPTGSIEELALLKIMERVIFFWFSYLSWTILLLVVVVVDNEVFLSAW